MFKTLALAIWCGALSVAGVYIASGVSRDGGAAPKKGAHDEVAWEMANTESINIPLVREGKLLGYIIVKFSFSKPKKHKGEQSVATQFYVLDEAFAAIYKESYKIGTELQKYDVKQLSNQILTGVQKRIGNGEIKELFVKEFNFVAAADIR